ncbi:MAG TPA: hypothetical protein VLJ42_05175 [Solirubrobacteraceae bacterium]|nr:hypothetical protein [Solirubrobacteraceae bacterium]
MLGLRSHDTRGKQVVKRLERIEEISGGRDVDVPQIQGWFAEGDEIVSVITQLVHRELDPRSVNEAEIRAWQADGREIERNYLGNQAKLAARSARAG